MSARVPARPGVARPEVRTDIQGLRALAVTLVFVYHLWPERLTGGFVGVDVFFVISGFLITGHLVRHPPRVPRDFIEFWGRRIRRLLPASLLVVIATVVGATLLLPTSRLAGIARDAIASTLSVQNWVLAADAVDYLAATNAPSPFQHYWSLGVEEQFYLVWPLLIALGVALAGGRVRRGSLGIGIGVFAVASLIVSIVWTAVDPAFAYFATPTRLWELAVGGMVAVLPRPRVPQWLAAALAWGALAAIGAVALLLPPGTPFPGAIAVAPVAATAVLLAVEAPRRMFSPGALLAARPVQFVGDTSYSVYLWHFPLIVLAEEVLGGELPLAAKLAVVGTTLALAFLSRTLVEDPVRRSTALRRLRPTYLLAGFAIAGTLAVSIAPLAQVSRVVQAQEAEAEANAEANRGCVGAAALVTPGCELRGTGITPDPAVAVEDKPDAYRDACFADKPFPRVVTCDYGKTDSARRVALVGNSHAGQWLPALQEVAADQGFAIRTYLASRCAVSTQPQAFDVAGSTEGCLDWGAEVVEQTIADGVDLVVLTAASDGALEGAVTDAEAAKIAGYRAVLERWDQAGIAVLVLRDTPQPLSDIVACVDDAREDPAACDGPRTEWLPPDPLVAAALEVGGTIRVADLSDLMCDDHTCFAVVGGVLVFFDGRHLSATYSRSLAPFLAPEIRAAGER